MSKPVKKLEPAAEQGIPADQIRRHAADPSASVTAF
jgi:hypothetical protein